MQNAIFYMVFLTWPPTKLLPIVEGNIRLLVLVYLIIRNKWKSAVISVKVGLSTSNCVGGELESGSWRPLHFFLLFSYFPIAFLFYRFVSACCHRSLPSYLPFHALVPSSSHIPHLAADDRQAGSENVTEVILWYRGYCQARGRVCKGCVDQREHRLRKARGSVTGEEAMWGE